MSQYEQSSLAKASIKYMLLNPLVPADFGISAQELVESINEFGCKAEKVTTNNTPDSKTVFFAYAYSLETLERLVNETQLDGPIVTVIAMYDQVIE
jgi:hypothetical protein